MPEIKIKLFSIMGLTSCTYSYKKIIKGDPYVIYFLGYDEINPTCIETYAQKLIGKTFQEVCDMDNGINSLVREDDNEYNKRHDNKNRKGGLGKLIEERFFHYKCNNDSKPDFDKAGVELKVTPYRINNNGSLSAKERLIITMTSWRDKQT